MLSYTPKQAAAACNIGINTIYHAIHTGRLRAYRPASKAYIILPEDIKDWIKTAPAVARKNKRR